MVETITPVVHGGRNRRYWTSIGLHVLGTTASAALLGVLLGGLGALLGAPWGRAGLLALALVSALYAARELFRLPVPLPDLDRQVPDWWRTFFSPQIAALLYGFELGVGFVTYLSYGTFAAVTAAVFVAGDPMRGALLCGAFGFARGLSIALVARPDPENMVERLGEFATGGKPRLVNGALLLTVAVAAALAST